MNPCTHSIEMNKMIFFVFTKQRLSFIHPTKNFEIIFLLNKTQARTLFKLEIRGCMCFVEDIPIAIFDIEDEEVKASVKEGTIIECVMDLLQEEIDADPTKQCFFTKGWRPLRIRVDKDSANAYGTFVGVFKSIQDDITYKTLHNMFPK